MPKKRILSFIIGVLFSIVFYAGPAFAYNINGYLADWGVKPFYDWVPNSPTINYTVENNYSRPGSDPGFIEYYDLEAMYFDDDKDNLYFAIVTSYPNTYGVWAEDMGISFDNKKAPETAGAPFLEKVDNPNSRRFFDFGLDINPLPLNEKVTKNIYKAEYWDAMQGVPYMVHGKKFGTFEIFNRYYPTYFSEKGERGTYVLEGRISKLLFGNIACGAPIRLIFSSHSCLKDWIYLKADCEGNCPDPRPVPIPEPATVILLVSGILGLGGFKLRKKGTK